MVLPMHFSWVFSVRHVIMVKVYKKFAFYVFMLYLTIKYYHTYVINMCIVLL